MDRESWLGSFRRHHIFWLEDETPIAAAKKLCQIFRDRKLFDASIVTGVTSSLQVLDAIRLRYLRPFDFGIFDVVLDKCQARLIQNPRSFEQTAPPPISDAEVYVDISSSEDLQGARDFAPIFNFSFDEVERTASGQAGLFVWAWSVGVCPLAHCLIYSASPKVRDDAAFLRMAGRLEILDKFSLFGWTTFEEYRETVARFRNEYIKSLINMKGDSPPRLLFFRRLIGTEQWFPEFHIKPEDLGELSVETALQDGDLKRESYIIHSVEKKAGNWRVEYDQVVEFKQQFDKQQPLRLIAEFEKFLAKRLRSCFEIVEANGGAGGLSSFGTGVDVSIVKAVLERQGDWTVKIRNREGGIDAKELNVPFNLVPLRGVLSGRGREIEISAEDLRDTYILSSFFLPWASDLAGSKDRKDRALREIRERFYSDIEWALDHKPVVPFEHPEDLSFVVSIENGRCSSYRIEGAQYRVGSVSLKQNVSTVLKADTFGDRMWREDGPPALEALKAVGAKLGYALFRHPGLLGEFRHCEGRVERRGELRLVIEAERRTLGVPFECMLYPNVLRAEEFLVRTVALARRITGGVAAKREPLVQFFNTIIGQRRPIRILLVASNVSNEWLPDIPEVDEEVAILEALVRDNFLERFRKVNVRALVTAEASLSRVLEELESGYDLIHFAGHGEYNNDDPYLSKLYFYAEPNCEGEVVGLEAQRIHYLQERLRPALVYLSCCHGADVSVDSSLEPNLIGLGESVVLAGVPTVVSFRWSITDSGARLLAERFYESLARHGRADVALRDARRAGWEQGWHLGDLLSPILISQ